MTRHSAAAQHSRLVSIWIPAVMASAMLCVACAPGESDLLERCSAILDKVAACIPSGKLPDNARCTVDMASRYNEVLDLDCSEMRTVAFNLGDIFNGGGSGGGGDNPLAALLQAILGGASKPVSASNANSQCTYPCWCFPNGTQTPRGKVDGNMTAQQLQQCCTGDAYYARLDPGCARVAGGSTSPCYCNGVNVCAVQPNGAIDQYSCNSCRSGTCGGNSGQCDRICDIYSPYYNSAQCQSCPGRTTNPGTVTSGNCAAVCNTSNPSNYNQQACNQCVNAQSSQSNDPCYNVCYVNYNQSQCASCRNVSSGGTTGTTGTATTGGKYALQNSACTQSSGDIYCYQVFMLAKLNGANCVAAMPESLYLNDPQYVAGTGSCSQQYNGKCSMARVCKKFPATGSRTSLQLCNETIASNSAALPGQYCIN